METCKHKNISRLYTRGETWKSTDLYKCWDCKEIFKKELTKVDTDSRRNASLGGKQ